MRNKHLVLLFLITLSVSVNAQFAVYRTVVPPKSADSLDIAYYSNKNPWRASGQIFGFNTGLWAFNRYVQKSDFAYINMNTIKKNFKKGFVWDNDQIGTNMFLHPYHGNLYFNSARSNGYNFWESGVFALGGSAMWELLLENEYPSINDIIATPIGGLSLGETLYRTSDLILDDRSTGRNRFGRELAAFVISPTRGLTRILNGDAWRKRSTSGKQFGIPDVSIEMSNGVRVLELKDPIVDKGVGYSTEVNIEYGDRFSDENEKPYDYFVFNGSFNVHSSQPVLGQLNILGRLHVNELIDTKKNFLSLGVYQHFDYYDSDTISDISNHIPYKFCSPASFGLGLIYKNKRFNKFNFDAYFHANVILLGGTLSDHYVVDKRNYNLASGFSIKGGANLAYKDKIGVTFIHETYRMFTWKGYSQDVDWNAINVHEFNYQGDRSQAILHALSFRMDLKLRKQMYLTGVYNNYIRDTNYKYFDDVFSKTSEGRLMLTYKF